MNNRIESPEALIALGERAREAIFLRIGPKQMEIMVHMGTCGIAAGARDVLAALLTELERVDEDKACLRQSSCPGLCDREPMVTLTDQTGRQFRYGKLDARKVRRIVQEHVIGGTPVSEFLIRELD